jgi:endonuclease/exonuclease/phosphatase (EEP) superfamily protein YafD
VVECSTSQLEHIRSWQNWHTVHAEPENLSADGIALFSMHPIRSVKIARTPNARLDHLTAIVDAPGGTFQVELTHPCPPVPGWLHQRQAELNQISTAATSSNWPVVVLGDLNETPYGASWRRLLKTSGLSATGPLGTPTWPSQLKGVPVPQCLGIRIDHILVGPEWEAGPLKVGPKITSDHRPIRVEIWLGDQEET